MDIFPLRAFEDNYIWLLRHERRVAAVDPGDAAPVLAYLAETDAELRAILVTHHHGDHTGGIDPLLARYPVPVFGPALESIPGITEALREGDTVALPGFPERLRVIDVPGHTRGHIAYYGKGALFCGDTLFGCGCGRLFEGSAAQMWASLSKLADLPADTRVYCAHEYTQSNIRFARVVEPDNASLQSRETSVNQARAVARATVPFLLRDELATNPFLRCSSSGVVAAAEAYARRRLSGEAEVFAVLREWKNGFR